MSFAFLAIIAAMSLELSRDLLRSAQLAGRFQATEGALRENERTDGARRQRSGARPMGLGVQNGAIWATDKTRAFFGFGKGEPLDFRALWRCTRRSRRRARGPGEIPRERGDYRSEYRILRNDGTPTLVSARGRVEFGASGRPVRMRGVSFDITERKQAEVELRKNREELAHVGRVALMGELAASLAHELNQPLTGIITNADVALRSLDRGISPAGGFREILRISRMTASAPPRSSAACVTWSRRVSLRGNCWTSTRSFPGRPDWRTPMRWRAVAK